MSEHKVVIAIHAYTAERDDDLSFEANDRIKVTDDTDPDWWVGQLKNGSSGYFPRNV
ncbi:SH3 domain-containing protein, partial [Pilobolus umbonatus]